MSKKISLILLIFLLVTSAVFSKEELIEQIRALKIIWPTKEKKQIIKGFGFYKVGQDYISEFNEKIEVGNTYLSAAISFEAKRGENVIAVSDGIIRINEHENKKIVKIIKDDIEIIYFYIDVNEDLKENDYVKKGQILGKVLDVNFFKVNKNKFRIKNSKIISILNGKVTNIGFIKDYGYFVQITDNKATSIVYYNLEINPKLKIGDMISNGELLGIAKSEDITNVSHISLSMKYKEKLIDPLEYFKE